MDDRAVLLARDVARAASAWFNAPVDVEAYRRLAAAVAAWNAYNSPALPESGEEPDDGELLDELPDAHPPQPLGAGLADLEATLRRAAREAL